jgi:hypothetical protein
MQKIGVGIVLLVIGAIIGLSVGMYVSMNQTPNIEEPIKVIIQRMEYTTSVHSILKIDLLNNVPEKNLEGFIIVIQNEKQWTSEVTWYYTGYGETEIVCDSINETQNFRVVYMENSPNVKAPYLYRIIEWNDVILPDLSFNFIQTEQLQITKVEFGSASTMINVTVMNTGTSNVIISDATVTGFGVTDASVSQTSIVEGTAQTLTLTTDAAWTTGNLYNIELISSKGTKFTYTDTS